MEKFVMGRYAKFQRFEADSLEPKSLLNYSDILHPEYEISEPKTRAIYNKLAIALEQNSVVQIKILKKDFGNDENFIKAKRILNDKCKQVWSVYKKDLKNIPHEAMKCLGISNQPELEFLLQDSVKYFEKDGGNTTAEIISKTLNNKNISYTITDIHKYLVDMHKKYNCQYNSNTVKYLLKEQNYTNTQLQELGINQETVKEAIQHLPLKKRGQFIFKNLKNQMQNYFNSALIK